MDPIEGDHVAERDDYVDLETSTLHICFSSLQVEFSDQVTHEIEVMAAKSVGNVRNLGKTFGGKAFQKFPQLLGPYCKRDVSTICLDLKRHSIQCTRVTRVLVDVIST